MTDPRDIIRFGTDGWRGIIADTFTFENVRIVTQAVADMLLDNGTARDGVVIGYDNRFHGETFARCVAEVLLGNNIPVRIGDTPVPTPVISFATRQYGLAGGIMITASHNPAEYSGLKFKTPYGASASPDITAAIEARVGVNPVKYQDLETARDSGRVMDFSLEEPYLAWIRNFIDQTALSSRAYTVVVDSMYGVGKEYIAQFLRSTAHKVTTIRAERNPSFGGIAPEPVPKNMEATRMACAELHADVALVTDGDADRLAALDARGEYIITPRIATVIARHLMENRKWDGSLIKTVSCSVVIDRFARAHGVEVIEEPVGFKHIVPHLMHHGALVGTEESGGLGFKNHIPERDGILGGLLFLEALAGLGFANATEAMEWLDSEYGMLRYDRQDCEVTPEQRETFLRDVATAPPKDICGRTVARVSDTDGIKFICDDDSWLLLRFSGTEPVVRFYAEAPTMKEAQEMTTFGRRLFEKE